MLATQFGVPFFGCSDQSRDRSSLSFGIQAARRAGLCSWTGSRSTQFNSNSLRRIFTFDGACTPIRTLSPLIRTIVTTMSSPRWMHSVSFLDKINIIEIPFPWLLLGFGESYVATTRRLQRMSCPSSGLRCRKNQVFHTANSGALASGVIKQYPGSLDVKDSSQSNAARAM